MVSNIRIFGKVVNSLVLLSFFVLGSFGQQFQAQQPAQQFQQQQPLQQQFQQQQQPQQQIQQQFRPQQQQFQQQPQPQNFQGRQPQQDNFPLLPPVFIPPGDTSGAVPVGQGQQAQSPVRNLFRNQDSDDGPITSLFNRITRFFSF